MTRAPGKLIPVALLASGLLAFWTRWQFVRLYGGCEGSYLAWAWTHYFGGLTDFYVSAAAGILRGLGYKALVYPPGYSLFLAGLARVGLVDVNQMRIAQITLDSSAVVAMYLLARNLALSRMWALAASVTYAIFPLWAAGSVFPLAESLSTLLVLCLLVLLFWLGTGRSWRPWIVGGATGLAVLVRPDLMLWFIPALVWVVWHQRLRESARPALAILVGFAVVLGSWGLHNRNVHGRWVFGSTSSGAGLWEGLGERPNPYGYVLDDSAAAQYVRATKGFEWASIEANDFLAQEYVGAWREHPGFVVQVIAARIPRILFESERLQPLFLGRARQLVDTLGLAFTCVAILLRRRHQTSVFVLLVLPLYALASIGIVHYEPRYVRYVEVSYVLGIFVVMSELVDWLRRRWRRVAAAAIVLLATGAIAYSARELRALKSASAVACSAARQLS